MLVTRNETFFLLVFFLVAGFLDALRSIDREEFFLVVKDSFEEMAKIYDKYRQANDQVLGVLLKEVKGLKTKFSILDIGCGTGNYCIPLAEAFNVELTGIDLSQEMLEQAREKFPEGRWLLQDIESSNFEDCSFDVVLMSYVIQHIKNYKQVLRKISKILKPKGKLLIVTDDHDQFHTSPYHQYIPQILEIDLKRFPRVDDLSNVLKEIGFDVHIHKVSREVKISSVEDVNELVKKGKAKFFSTLTLITSSELNQGLESLKKAMINELKLNPIVRVRERTILVAQSRNLDV